MFGNRDPTIIFLGILMMAKQRMSPVVTLTVGSDYENSDAAVPLIIVEDDPAVRALLRSSLEKVSRYQIVGEYGRGKEAIAEVLRVCPKIALVDIGLPDISGVEVISYISSKLPDANVLVITAFGDSETVLRAIAAGADGYILKGGNPEELNRDIQVLESGGSPLSPSIARQLLRKFHRPATVDDLESLTPRETEILQLTARGLSYSEVADACRVKAGTVHTHLKSIYRKLAVHSKTEAVFEARVRGIITD